MVTLYLTFESPSHGVTGSLAEGALQLPHEVSLVAQGSLEDVIGDLGPAGALGGGQAQGHRAQE